VLLTNEHTLEIEPANGLELGPAKAPSHSRAELAGSRREASWCSSRAPASCCAATGSAGGADLGNDGPPYVKGTSEVCRSGGMSRGSMMTSPSGVQNWKRRSEGDMICVDLGKVGALPNDLVVREDAF
jgi:hypothetical protein